MAKVLGDADVGWAAAPKKKTLSDADVGWSTPDAIDQSALDTQSTFGAIKDVGLGALKNLGKAGVAAVDFLAGVPGQAVGVGADIGVRTYGALTGESKRNISEAGRLAAEHVPASIGLSKTPATDFMKRLGVEEYNQEGVAQALDTFAKGVAKRTGGLLDQNDIMSLFDTAMMAGGAHGVDAGVKAAMTKPKEIGAANRGTYVGQEAPSGELQFTQRAAPTGEEIGSVGQFEQSGEAGPVRPKSRIGETPLVGEPIPALNSALAKVKEGRTFDMTAEERIAFREFKNAPDRIQKGAIDPELLQWMAIGGVAATIGGVELARYLKGKEREDTAPKLRDAPIKGPDGETLAGLGILTAGVLRGKFKGSHESVILKAAQEGNPEAFGEIYRREAPRLERVASRYVQDQAQAKDLVQEAMISAYKALPEFKGDSKLSTWLHRIVVNKALNKVEAEGRQIKGEELSPEVEQHVAGDSRTPMQELQNKQLGEALQAGLDKLDSNMREAFQLRELEGMDYEAIAAQQGVPIGTVRSRIARAKEALQGHLKEYGGKYATVAGVAGATALMDEEATAENAALAAAILAVKAKGGMWHPEAVERLSRPMLGSATPEAIANLQRDFAHDPIGGASHIEPRKVYAENITRMIKTYLNKHAGTATDPLKDVEVPYGEGTKPLGEIMDAVILSKKGHEYGHNMPVGVKPEETVWRIERRMTPQQGLLPARGTGDLPALTSYLSHVGDYLREHVSPEKLGQYDLVRAVKETAKWDEELAKNMDKARLAEKGESPILKEYPDGMYWQQLTKPGQFARESDAMGHSVRGYEPHRQPRLNEPGGGVDKAHPDWIPASGNSGHPSYGLGGWDAIKSGDAKVYSLRDAKGRSHVTVEVLADTHRLGRMPADEITQIKGKQNRAPSAEYLPYVQDFVKSGKWGEVGDLEYTGLTKHPEGHYYTRYEAFDESLKQVDKAIAEKGPLPQLVEARASIKQMRDKEIPPRDVTVKGPQSQRGSVDKNLVIGLGAIGAGATVGMAALGSLIDPERPLQNAFYGALAGAAFGTQLGRATLKEAIKSPDKTLGLVSTRLYNIAPALRRQLRRHENRVLKAVDAANDQALPFIQALDRLPKETKAKIDNALLNGKTEVLQQIPELAQTYPAVRKLLGSIEGQLQALGRFGEGVSNYFPRLVKDFEGLREAIGLDASVGLEKRLLEAEAKMNKKEGRSLTDVEQSIITNRYLFSADETSFQPGFAKSRKMRDVPEHLQQFYAPPTESLLRYITGATNDLEIARFFGKDLATKRGGKKLFNDVDGSIGNLTNRLLLEGKLTQPQSMELRDILKARFEGGEQGMSSGLAAIRNITNTGLLGNIASAATQIGDSLMTIYHHGLVPTLQATAQTILGKQRITPKQLGLINHVAEELSEMGKTGRALHVAMKYSGFHAVDMFAKGLGLNAALIKNAKLVATPAGEAKFRAKYQTSFEGDTNALIRDLKEGRSSDLVDELVFSELSDAQPISKAEMPELYLRHPNGRLLYQLKTYMLKQSDIIRRDAYQEIAKGTPQGIMTGTKNLAALATVYAFANVPGDVVKDYISGRDTDPLATPKLVENVFQTFGVNRYAAQQIGQGKVVETAIGIATPPVRVMQDIAKLNEKSVAYVPFIGRPVYDRFLGGNEKREIYETRAENRGKPKADRKPLSPEAKEYLRKQRDAKKAKEAR